jgi:hypothetical protein
VISVVAAAVDFAAWQIPVYPKTNLFYDNLMTNQHGSVPDVDGRALVTDSVSPKSYGVAVALSMIFGIMGIHHFYIGNWLHGVADLGMFIGGILCLSNGDPAVQSFGLILLLADVGHTVYVTYRLFVGECRDGNGLIIAYPGQFK